MYHDFKFAHQNTFTSALRKTQAPVPIFYPGQKCAIMRGNLWIIKHYLSVKCIWWEMNWKWTGSMGRKMTISSKCSDLLRQKCVNFYLCQFGMELLWTIWNFIKFPILIHWNAPQTSFLRMYGQAANGLKLTWTTLCQISTSDNFATFCQSCRNKGMNFGWG